MVGYISASGGIVAIVVAIVALARGIFRQVNATEQNTKATIDLKDVVAELGKQLNDHETRITVIERARK